MSDTPQDQDTPSASGDATGEFFSVGTPLHAVRAGYIRRRADDLLYEAAIAGRYAHIIAPDRSGKSSLIASTAARLEGHGVSVATLDLAQISERDGGQDAGRWYYNVAYRLMRQLRIRFDLQDWWQDKSMLSNRQRLVEFYSEIVLPNVAQNIVVFIDSVQYVDDVPVGDQLLASIRAAYDARTTDPDFQRLTFVLLGECDPLSLVNEPSTSPFNATQPIPLDDFARENLELFATELNLESDAARRALDRVYHWTRGQPYLTQKLARAIAREQLSDDIEANVDRIVAQQLTGRAALHSEPHLSHIHRAIVNSGRMAEGLLNLYGKLRKGIEVPADLGSPLQRRLMSAGLIEIDASGELRVRNRIYEAVFTARWANENLPLRWRAPALVTLTLLVIAAIPFWYTQWLPAPYVRALTAADTELAVARSTWTNLRSFPGHAETADSVYRGFLEQRARSASTVDEIEALGTLAGELPQAGAMPQRLVAEFWDRSTLDAMRRERRDEALLAALHALELSTPVRRNRSAMLVGNDYQQLLASSPPNAAQRPFVFNAGNLLLTSMDGARIEQFSLGTDGLTRNDPWIITALEVTPLVRRVIVDREGSVRRAGLTLNISHPRMADLRIKIIAPSGRTVEIVPGVERASSNDDIRIPGEQLAALQGESLRGTWSLSLRDEATGVSGHFVGWNLTLNSQGLVEGFQRGLGIPDPVEREAERLWISEDGRYAIARAEQSDSARLWDLAFAQPVAAIAVGESEQLVGVDAGARHLVTATLDTINLWDTARGRRVATLPVVIAGGTASLTRDGQHLFVQRPGDVETVLERWRLDTASRVAALSVAGAPALVASDASGARVAIADYDRAIRVWDFATGNLLMQIDLPMQPSELMLNAGGDVLAAVFANSGVSVWRLADPRQPMLETFGAGRWQLMFSPSGARFVAGRPESGYRLYETRDGRLVGPAFGVSDGARLYGFSREEDTVVTSGPGGSARFWQLPVATVASETDAPGHRLWPAAADAVVAALPGARGIAVGDRSGHVHILDTDSAGGIVVPMSEDVSFLGHNAAVRRLVTSPDGGRLASVGDDGSLRVWNSDSGLPQPFITSIPGGSPDRIVFSSSGERLAALGGNRVVVFEADSGELLAALDLGETHNAISFAGDDALYLGSSSGALNVVDRDSAGVWNLRRIWGGEQGIRLLEASPRGRFLVVVDRANRAGLFDLANGQPGELNLLLPSPVFDAVFSPDGSRVLLRSARWVHRASASRSGLRALDSLFVPQPLTGARTVFDDAGPDRGAAFFLPVARDGVAHLARFRFADAEGPGLFGNKDKLIAEWTRRLGLEAKDEAGAE